MDLRVAKVWEILRLFKINCQIRGWKTSEHEDWVKTGDASYHNFLWTQTVNPSTFEKICADHKIAIRNAISYKVVDVSYMAWLFLQSPPENIIQRVEENLQCSRKTAIYDLSYAFNAKPFCLKLNETNSTVFKEFERFLEEELTVRVRKYILNSPITS